MILTHLVLLSFLTGGSDSTVVTVTLPQQAPFIVNLARLMNR